MRRLLAALTLAAATGGAHAADVQCHVRGDYRFSLDEGVVRYERAAGTPTRVEFRADGLWIDGREAELVASDRERARRFAAEARRLAPEMREVALEALDIAFTTLDEVARALSDSPRKASRRLADARRKVAAELDGPLPFGDAAADALVEDVVSDLVPALVGDLVQGVVWAALRGDTERVEALEARAERMEREIDRLVAPRARALEVRADALCQGLARLDAIEDELEYRLPGGEALDLLRSGPE